MKKRVVFILIALVICVGTFFTFKKEFDQFNPFYTQEYVYVSINKPGKPEGQYIRYRYNLTGYTEQGKKKKITFSSSKELSQGSYVKVLAKGAYTKKWILIEKKDMPKKALQ